jgi:hypothetical protein
MPLKIIFGKTIVIPVCCSPASPSLSPWKGSNPVARGSTGGTDEGAFFDNGLREFSIIACTKEKCQRKKGLSNVLKPSISGGATRDRTAGLLNAIQALSQLSYSPSFQPFLGGVSYNKVSRECQ